MQELSLSYTHITQCPICGSRDHKLLYKLDEFSVFICPCGYKHLDPCLDDVSQTLIYQSSEMLRKINPALGNYYEYLEAVQGSKTEKDYISVLNVLEKMTSGRKMLDVGCGNGVFLSYAKKQGWEVKGLDSSKENAEDGRKRYGIEIESVPFESFIENGMKWDVITLWDLIEHPSNPGFFLDKTRELLTHDGVLVLATPNDRNILSFLACWIHKLTFGKLSMPVKKLYFWEHASYFSPATLSALLEKYQFSVTKVVYTETDLDRYHFHPVLKLGLRCAVWIASFFSLQNRMIVFSKKS